MAVLLFASLASQTPTPSPSIRAPCGILEAIQAAVDWVYRPNCRAQRGPVIVTYSRGDVTRWYLAHGMVAALQSRPRERQMYVTVLPPAPSKVGTRDLHLRE